ncbi:NAD-dependent protein deacetylase [Pseudonocardia sp. N23]|uniref:NAD-dependent protein deacetylase n=1 Tax=Pseudonocardia sp. N23 TaxID=1987376 RepID=UPI000BFC7965|nr:NAD-dependent protein deacetylase [Pseudonocardia sp. N23]
MTALPAALPATTAPADAALALLAGRPLVALTGAGLSTDSGIPDYRGPNSPARAPMTISEFRSGDDARRRYWARSHVGWARMRRAEPNPGHHALAALERAGVLRSVITQNVDGLHGAAGSRDVVDLHGRIDEVVCLDCADVTPRDVLQARLAVLNPGFAEAAAAAETAPDGDAVLDDTDGFVVAACRGCGGVLKPHVVFFGENVPRHRVDRSYALVEGLATDAGGLLVAGSSLTVMSGLRFVKRAHALGVVVVILNRGATRGDPFATLCVDAGCSETLTALAAAAQA